MKTANYTFKTYDPAFLEQQIALVKQATADWEGFGYPTKEQLLQTYSGDNFTPHTRYYAFLDDELVGFLSSALDPQNPKRGNLQFPFVRPGHEKLRAKLMEEAFQTFRNEGREEITTNLQTSWTGADTILEGFGFEKQEIINAQLLFRIEDIHSSELPLDIDFAEVNPENDRQELIRVFSTEMTQTPDQIGGIIDQWPDNENIIMNHVSWEEGQIITHSMVFGNNNDQELAQMTHISVYDEKYQGRRAQQLHFMVQQLAEMGYQSVQVFAIPDAELESYHIPQAQIRKNIRYKKHLAPEQIA